MKILLTGSKVDYGLAMSYQRAFKENNWEAVIFPEDELYEEELRFAKNRYLRGIFHRLFWKLFCKSINKKFIETIKKEKPDLIFVLKGWHFSPRTLLEIRKKYPAIPIFCFNQENPFNTRNLSYSNSWIVRSIPIYDVYFIWVKFLIEKIKKAGAKRVEYLPFGYDPVLHYPVKVTAEEKNHYGSDIAFVGSWDKERERWFNYLWDYDFKIWGNAWGRANKKLQEKWQKRAAVGEEFSKVCNSSKIVLDILRRQMIVSHSMKTFEIPACGGFLLCNQGEEVNDFFKEGEEIVTFNTPQEMLEKIDYFLKNEELRKKIAEAGYKKLVDSDYSYTDRAKRILEIYKILI